MSLIQQAADNLTFNRPFLSIASGLFHLVVALCLYWFVKCLTLYAPYLTCFLYFNLTMLDTLCTLDY